MHLVKVMSSRTFTLQNKNYELGIVIHVGQLKTCLLLVLLSAHIERLSVSRKRDFSLKSFEENCSHLKFLVISATIRQSLQCLPALYSWNRRGWVIWQILNYPILCLPYFMICMAGPIFLYPPISHLRYTYQCAHIVGMWCIGSV